MKAIDIFTTRFFNRLDCYYIWDDYLGRFDAKRKPVTPELVQAHLNNKITVSAPALNTDGYCKWCAWDSDDDSDNLDKIESMLISLSWQPLREARRAGRAGHSWLFFDIPVKAVDLLLFDKEIRKRASVENGDIEFFPKQDTIAKDGMGNGLRLPLGKNRKPDAGGAIGWFESCIERTIASQLDWFSMQPLNPGEKIAEIAHMVKVEEAAKKTKQYRKKFYPLHKGQIDFKVIAGAALSQAQSIAENWLPGGKGNVHYMALNPRRNDNHAGSFSINLRNGRWKDFATNDAKGNDLISLVAYLDNCSQLEAAMKLATFIGYSTA
jgi:hypothetical protein